MSLIVTIARVFSLSRPRQWLLLGGVATAAFLYHANHMLTVIFDYGLNVALCVAAGAVQSVLWAAWALRWRHPRRGRLLLFLVRLRKVPGFSRVKWGGWGIHALGPAISNTKSLRYMQAALEGVLSCAVRQRFPRFVNFRCKGARSFAAPFLRVSGEWNLESTYNSQNIRKIILLRRARAVRRAGAVFLG